MDCDRFAHDLPAWIDGGQQPQDIASAVHYLVLAIGAQTEAQDHAAAYFRYAKTLALASLDGNLGVGTAQAFALITVYMLRACQINGAFLFFGKSPNIPPAPLLFALRAVGSCRLTRANP